MTSIYNFKKITPVPTGTDFLDIILSKTQRKTPTVCTSSPSKSYECPLLHLEPLLTPSFNPISYAHK